MINHEELNDPHKGPRALFNGFLLCLVFYGGIALLFWH